MVQTDYKSDQFVNRPLWPFSFLVGLLSTVQGEVVPFTNQAERFESWPNGMKVVQPPGWLESCLNKQHVAQTM